MRGERDQQLDKVARPVANLSAIAIGMGFSKEYPLLAAFFIGVGMAGLMPEVRKIGDAVEGLKNSYNKPL